MVKACCALADGLDPSSPWTELAGIEPRRAPQSSLCIGRWAGTKARTGEGVGPQKAVRAWAWVWERGRFAQSGVA